MRPVHFCWLAVLLMAGCGSQSVVPVSGQVTLDGQPLVGVVVYFQPADDRSNPGTGSVGTTDSSGYYVLRQIQPQRNGAVVGEHRVTIRPAPSALNSDTSLRPGLNALLQKLSADLRYPVPAGGTPHADFHLHSAPKS